MKQQPIDSSYITEKKINYEMKHRKSFFQLDFEPMVWSNVSVAISQYAQIFQGVVQFQNKNGQLRTTTYKCYESYIIKTKKNVIIILFQGVQASINYNNAILQVIQANEHGFGIRLTKCLDQLEFFGEYEKWFNVIKRYAIQTEFTKKYTLIKKLKCLSNAQVLIISLQQFQAKHKITGYDYMVTIYTKKNLSDLKDQRLITEQLQIMRSLQDEQIQSFYEAFESQDHIYIVSEIFFGGNLMNYLQKWPLLSEDRAIKFFYRIFRALAYMHSKQIMHRDIKPEKIGLKFKDNLDTASIMDFHLAEYYQKGKSDYIYKRCGTPGFVAPEIIANEPYDCKVDIFSTGVILYLVLTGIHPFNCEDYKELINLNLVCEIDFSRVHISDEGIGFLKAILDPSPEIRLDAQQAINHLWFKNERISRILEFKNRKQFKQLSQKKIQLPSVKSMEKKQYFSLKQVYQSPTFQTKKGTQNIARITQSITVQNQNQQPYANHRKTMSHDISQLTLKNQLNDSLFQSNTQRGMKKLKVEDIKRFRSTLMLCSSRVS